MSSLFHPSHWESRSPSFLYTNYYTAASNLILPLIILDSAHFAWLIYYCVPSQFTWQIDTNEIGIVGIPTI